MPLEGVKVKVSGVQVSDFHSGERDKIPFINNVRLHPQIQNLLTNHRALPHNCVGENCRVSGREGRDRK